MKRWARILIRALSVANLLQAVVGLVVMGEGVFRATARFETTGRHYAVFPYRAMIVINLVFLLTLIVGSIYLWKLSRRGLHVCNVLFFSELGYWLLLQRLSSASFGGGTTAESFRIALDEAAVMGNMGLWPQLLTLYPLIALLLLNLAYWKSSETAKH